MPARWSRRRRSSELFGDPRHPYTQGLIRSIPRVDRAAEQKQRLEAIPGTVPSLLEPPPGCRFAARCRYVDRHLRARHAAAEGSRRPATIVRCVL